MRVSSVLLIWLWVSVSSVFAQDQPEGAIEFSVFLIGDAGEHKPFRDAVLTKATTQMGEAGEQSAVVFLGDNIYPKGLPPEGHPDREEMEGKLIPQLDVMKQAPGRSFIVPGNHDWAKGKIDGVVNIAEQETFTREYLQSDDAFHPQGGCPGPVEKQLTEDIILVLIDTQWLLAKEENRGDPSNCNNKTEAEVMASIKETVERNQEKQLIVAAHHPVHTFGSHGGVYQFKQHLFPLTDMKKWLYLPLPVIGSIYPLYRTWFGNIQDATNKRYQAIMNKMVTSLENHPAVIHAAGHEHALEYSAVNGVEYIVSGSGCKTEFVKKKGPAIYVSPYNGFVRVDYYSSGQVWADFWIFNKDHADGIRDQRIRLFDQE